MKSLSEDQQEVWDILENAPKSWQATVQEDSDGELYLVFPPALLERVGWEEGDDIKWSDNGDGSYTLSKVE